MLRYLSLLLISSSILGSSVRCEDCPRIIIVGAGSAGIAAASRLLENGFNRVTILEAENRTGGRVYTTHFGNDDMDLGAQWCEGADGNLVYELAKDYNLLAKDTDPIDSFKYSARYSTGEAVDPVLAEEAFGLYWNIYFENQPEQEMTYEDYLPKKYQELANKKYGSDPAKLKLALDMLETFKVGVLTIEGAFSLSDVSAKSDYVFPEGGELYWKKGGYQNILDILIHKFPNPTKELPVLKKTILNKEVTRITYKDGEDVVVDCSDGSSYSADHVIFTASLGVLKHRHETLFHPPLPSKKVQVIKDLGIAAIIKVVLYYQDIWWPKQNFSSFTFVWSEEDRKNAAKDYPHGPHQSGKSWLLDALGAFTVREKPNYLMVWFAGPLAPEIEKLSDQDIQKGIMFLLNKFVGHQFGAIPTPDDMIRSNWYTNEHFRGSYSYCAKFGTIKVVGSSASEGVVGAFSLFGGVTVNRPSLM